MKKENRSTIFILLLSFAATHATEEPIGGSLAEDFRQNLPGNWRDIAGFLYVTDYGRGNMLGLAVDADGSLTPIEGSPFSTKGSGPTFAGLLPNTQQLYVTNYDPSFAIFNINAVGQLSHVKGSPIYKMGRTPRDAHLQMNGNRFWFFKDRQSTDIRVYKENPDGSRTEIPHSPFATGGLGTIAIKVAPNRKFLFVSNGASNTITVFSINQDTGDLTPVPGSPFAAGGQRPSSILVSPDERFLFVANRISNTVSAFSIAESGALTPVPGSPFATSGRMQNNSFTTNDHEPSVLEIDDRGKRLFVLNDDSNSVYVFNIDTATGTLTPLLEQVFQLGEGAGAIELLYVAVPKKLKNAQVLDLLLTLDNSQQFKNLPQDIKLKIAETKFGKTFNRNEVKQLITLHRLQKRVRGNGITSLDFDELIAYLPELYYDKTGIAGGLLQRIAALFVTVKRGTLTGEGFRLLEEWTQEKNSKELLEYFEKTQEELQEPSLKQYKKDALNAIKDHLYFRQKNKEQEEMGE